MLLVEISKVFQLLNISFIITIKADLDEMSLSLESSLLSSVTYEHVGLNK